MGHTSFQLDRRAFLKAGVLAAGGLMLGPEYLRQALAHGPATVAPSPYGDLQPFDSNGIALPPGFSSREIARGGTQVNGSTPPYVWHGATDGQATFATLDGGGAPDGGWILVANSEMPLPGTGGVSGVEFAPDGGVERAYRVLTGTTANCAGGPAPWGKWLSCEEHEEGQVWECDPTGAAPGVPRPAMGLFSHEAACVDPSRMQLYMTEDEPDGCFYRFTPTAYPDLSSGLLEVLLVEDSGTVSWEEVPNPSGGGADPTREQVSGAERFNGGEGLWYDRGVVYFTTKGDSRVWAYHVDPPQLHVLYDAAAVESGAPLSGVDNITVSPVGDIYVCEDRADHDICLITSDFEVSRFLKLDPVIHAGPSDASPIAGNETVGVVFSPSGERMYFGAQRSFAEAGQVPRGVVYEISGPFRLPPPAGGGGDEQQPPGQGNLIAPGVSLLVRKRMRIERFLDHGLPVQVELDEPTGIEARLRIFTAGGPVTIGRVKPSVAVRHTVGLRLAATTAATRVLRRRDSVDAHLKLVATDGAGNRTVVRRTVKLFR